jgi:hypothetical protein
VGDAFTVNKGRMCRKVLATWRRGGQRILNCPRMEGESDHDWGIRQDRAWIASHRN